MLPNVRGRKNAEEALLADFENAQEDGLDYPEAYCRLVLDYEGIDKTPAYREIHTTGGHGDYGFDFCELYAPAKSALIYQFKSHDPTDGLPKDAALSPEDLTDVRRILDVLEKLGSVPKDSNPKTQEFLKQLHLQLHQTQALEGASPVSEENELGAPTFSIEIVLAAFVERISPQAQKELDALIQRASSLRVDGMQAAITIRTLLIKDLIERKWQEINVDWIDRSGTKRDTITLMPKGEVIRFRSSLVFWVFVKECG